MRARPTEWRLGALLWLSTRLLLEEEARRLGRRPRAVLADALRRAAEGYARSTGRVGVVLTTSGPGLTNIITPLQDARGDSTPILALSGQVPTAAVGTDAFQECPAADLTPPCTKGTYQIKSVEEGRAVGQEVSVALFCAIALSLARARGASSHSSCSTSLDSPAESSGASTNSLCGMPQGCQLGSHPRAPCASGPPGSPSRRRMRSRRCSSRRVAREQ